jgi:activating signal cointegrator 1
MNTLFPGIETKYKVLTLWQPWATLLVNGAKRIETRPTFTNWTNDKGIYLIHAAQKWTPELDAISKRTPFKASLQGFPITKGAIIGSIEVIECTPIIEDYEGNISLLNDITLTSVEIAFGDYREGRYAWICKNPRMLETPIPYKNGQGYYQNYKRDINLLNFK